MKKLILFIAILLLVIASVGAIRQTNKSNLDVRLKKVQIEDNSAKIKLLEDTRLTNEEKIRKAAQEKAELEKKNKELEAQVLAKAQIKEQRGAVAYAASMSTESEAKAFIYHHESGNRTNAVNEIGACGLGQALPCSKMNCSLSDYACQDTFFTKYMQQRYGTWSNAKAFWQANRWW